MAISVLCSRASVFASAQVNADFEQTIGDLLRLAEQSRTAHMCAERAHFGRQRMIVSDWLVGCGHEVLHIDAEGPTRPHRLTSEARMVDGRMIYRGSQLF